ncbi:uncharacterized protein SPSK_09889 [Sporothrix schenckii 1099-18]|uniref:Uncharacterized protein n=2 Tax=Sporothrix schenckii TaxID=29908 RepID=U7PZT9_SPOS1|nr:uncharacterized protein SPSK_09889 [Sporothrix schenckii 1099-18]ERT00265.1 hypothetical protein HMPREF1624_03636 [Sporothrix schenckii ATCC 58251]KJR85271.1 hypothetical protein SPSK_09889 [Sporothrix schenckii 1099-18]
MDLPYLRAECNTLQATKETSDLGEAHVPKAASVTAFGEIEHELKTQLVHLRHEHDKHEPESFAVARNISDHDLASFSADDFVLVRVASTAYGLILFGKLRLPALAQSGSRTAYVHFRAFSEGPDQPAKFHSFHTADIESADGHKSFRSLFAKDDPLDWFDA